MVSSVSSGLFTRLFIAAMLLLSSAAQAATQLTAKVDRNPVMERESFVLEIVANDSLNTNDLDLSPLNRTGLTVGRTATSSQTQIVNGQITKTTTWSVVLVAKRAGKYQIPALTIDGARSRPIELEVIKVDPNNSQQTQPIFLKNQVESTELYLQQSTRMVTRLYFSPDVELQSGTLSDPELDNAYIKQQGKDKNTSEIIMGKRFQVIERIYSVTPQTSGEFTLVSPTFNGEVLANNRRRSMFSLAQTKPISAFGDDITINVRPIPKDYQGAWLASELVRLDQELQPNKTSYEVGEAITRTFTLTALNVNEEQLPEVAGNYPSEFKVYPDQSESHSALRQNAMVAQRISSEAIVANKAGSYTLPEVVVPWFNVKTKRQEFARLPEQTIQVVNASGSALSSEQAFNTANNESEVEQECSLLTGEQESKEAAQAPWWAWLGWPLWVITIVVWLVTLKFKSNSKTSSNNERNDNTSFDAKALKKACANNDAAKARAEILNWGRRQFGQQCTLDNIKQLANPELKQALDEMDASQFGRTAQSWQGQRLWQAFGQNLKRKNKEQSSAEVLPKLNN